MPVPTDPAFRFESGLLKNGAKQSKDNLRGFGQKQTSGGFKMTILLFRLK